jgi:hypothetical protein
MQTSSISFQNPEQTSHSVDQPDCPDITTFFQHPQLEHQLIVDMANPFRTEDQPSSRRKRAQLAKAFPRFLDRLREIVRRDCNMSESAARPRIDSVRFRALHFEACPGELTFSALDGLRPRHVEFSCGWDEECDIGPLDKLSTTWPLESMVIDGGCGVELTSSCMYSIKSLTLDYCCDISIASYPQPSALRNLMIIQNNAIDMFIRMRRDTSVADYITMLQIKSTNGCDFCNEFSSPEFFETLNQCATLRSLDLTLNDEKYDKYIRDIPQHFPPNIEHLRFMAPPSVSDEMASWLRCAADPTWLTNLKTISFHLGEVDIRTPSTHSTPPSETPAVVTQFLDTLSARLPSLSVVQ